MKNYILSFIVFALCMSGLQAQSPEKLTWFGLDYTQVKFIGLPEHFRDLEAIQNNYFASWNGLFLSEQSKYDVKKAFGVRQVSYSMDKAIQRSQTRDMDGIVVSGSWELGKKELAQVLKAYIDRGGEGTGALFIMESLNKLEDRGTMWLVVFDIPTGEISHLKRYSGKPGGFGFRNYWARSYYNVLTDITNNPTKPF